MTLGHETGSYLDHTTLARIVRARCGAGATPEAAWELLTLVAEQVYSRTAPNATVHPLDDGRVVAFTSFGWKEIPRAGAEARVLRILVELLQEANEVGYVDPDDLEALRKRPVASDFIGGLADALPLEGPRGRGALLDRVGAWTRYVATHTRSSHYYEELRDRWLTPRRADEIVPGFLAGR
jgi:hypothetical protein